MHADFRLRPFQYTSSGFSNSCGICRSINIHFALSSRCQSVLRICCSVADVKSSTSPAPSTQRPFQAYFNRPTKHTLAFVRDLADIRRLARLSLDIPVETMSTNDVSSASHVDASDSNATAVISLVCLCEFVAAALVAFFAFVAYAACCFFSENHVLVVTLSMERISISS